jgi:hypothetical protein
MEREMVGDVGAAARSTGDEATAESRYQEGRAMELNDAIAYALEFDGA